MLLFSSCVAVFILECQVHGTKIDIARCDGQKETGDIFSVNYTAINSHCNCTILPRYEGILKFASNTIQENCYTEITIHELQQPELSSILIPCKGGRQTPAFKVTQDSFFYMTSRSVNTTTAPQRFLQNIIIFGIADGNSSKALISVTCGATLQSSSAKPSDVITTADNGYSSTTGANSNFVTKTSHLESIQPPSTTEEIQCKAFLSLQIPLAIFVVISIVSTIMNMYFYIHFKLRKKCGSKTTNVQISPRSGTEATAETYTELGNTVSENQYDSLAGQDNYTHMNV